ncbi:hypothetical protein J3F84DRAFT_368282 [Trichoderma pleuroticola]
MMLDAGEVIIATGLHSARIMDVCIPHRVNHMWTVSTLQLHECSIVVRITMQPRS